ncbi:MAG: DUF2207 domain-containing protein [Patescibacteria group bacterium]
MDFWQALKIVIKQSGFYKKQMIFTSFVFLFVFGGIIFFRSQSFNAAELMNDNKTDSMYGESNFHLTVEKNGNVLAEGKKFKKINVQEDSDVFHWEVLTGSNEYISRMNIYMALPDNILASEVKPRIIDLNYTSNSGTKNLDDHTVLYYFDGIGMNSNLTIEMEIPKGKINYPFTQVAYNYLFVQNVNWWLYASAILAIISFILITILLQRRVLLNRSDAPRYALDHLPSDLPPAVVSVLKNGRVGSRDIAATLVDLAQRGFINIYSRGADTFTFGKSSKLGSANPVGLRNYEQVLLSKIFSESYKSTKEDIQMRIGRHIFSRKIAEVYFLIYESAMSYGFFEENPQLIHRKYKLGGILIFFFSMFGFIATLFLDMAPEYSMFAWFAIMVCAMYIVKLSSKVMPRRTSLGNTVRKEWLAYENYICEKKPIPFNQDLTALFSKNLPYAIILGKEVEWTERFLSYPFCLPSWLDSTEQIISLDQFVNHLFPLVGYVGISLDEVHEPTVD